MRGARKRLVQFSISVALAASMFVALSVGNPIRANAEDYQCGSTNLPHNYHDGIYASPNYPTDYFEGASAVVTNEASSVCDSVTGAGKINWTNAYTMATDGSSYIQTGFISWYDSGGQYFFGQVNDMVDGYGKTAYSANAIANGLDTHYWEDYQGTSGECDCIKGMINGDDYVKTDEDPTVYWGLISGEWSAETLYPGSDVPGYSTSKVHFYGLETQQSSGTFQSNLDTTGSYNDQADDWSQSAITSGHGLGNEWYEWTAAA